MVTEISRDTEPGRPGISPGLSVAIDALAAELEGAEGEDAAALGIVYLLGLGDPLAARGWLERGLATRDGFRAMLLCAVAAADRPALAQLGPRVGRVRGERAAAARELAEIWLYHLRDPAAAASALLAAGAAGGALGRVTLSLADMDAELEAELASGSPRQMAEAAAVAWDLAGDDRAVLELLAGAGDELSLLELAVEVAASINSSEREIAGLEALVAALERRHGDSPIAAALRFQLAERVAASGDAKRAAELYVELARGGGEEVGPHLALRGRLRAAVVAGDRPAMAAAYRELASRAAESDGADVAAVYHRRAAQLSTGDEAIDGWKAVLALEPDDVGARAALEVIAFRRGPAEHLAMLEWIAENASGARAEALRAAAAVAHASLEDDERAAELISGALVADPRSELAQLQALWAPALRGEVGEASIAGWVERVSEPPDSLLAGAAAMAINAGAADLTLQILAAAARDGVALALAGAALSDAERWAELADTWGELVDTFEAPRARRAIALDLGRLAISELGDIDRARRAIVVARDSGAPPAALAALEAAVFRAGGDSAAATEALESALASLADPETGRHRDPATALSLLLDLAEVALDAGEPARALERVTQARDLAPRHGRLLKLQVRAARSAGDDAALLAALAARREVAGGAEVLELVREIAAITRELESPDSAIAAYREVLAAEPGDAAALEAIAELAGGAGDWALVAEVFAAAPESAAVLAGRARALRELERWRELVAVLERRLERSHSDPERADLATELAELYDGKLDEPETAVRLYREAATYSSGDPARRSALIAVLDAQGRWSELVPVLRSEIDRARGAERVELSLRLAETLHAHLDRASEAAEVLESILELDPDCAQAHAALESIYDQIGDDAELLRVLERRAETARFIDRPALLMRRIANLRGAAGDIDGALAAHNEAFAADPDDRATTGAIERLCRDHRRFNELVEHYESILERVDAPAERAEWLARKGEVELRYLGNVGAALASLTSSVELDPTRAGSFEMATAVCTREREWGRLADLCVRRAAALEGPERIKLLRRAAQIAGRHLDDRERVRDLDRRLLDEGERAPGVLDDIESRAEASEDWELLALLAERRLENARGGDDTIELLDRIATIAAERLLDEKRAIAHYIRILEIAPSHKPTLQSLARILEATEEWSRFLEVTERLISLTTEDNARALLLFKCGSVLEARFDDDERAIEYYRSAIDASVKCMPAVHGLRDLYRRRGDWERVVETLELETKLWTEPRERAGIYAQIGTIYAKELAQPRRALDYFESALAVDPDSLPANLALFDHYFATGNWKRALPLAERMSRKAVRAGDLRTRSEFYRRRGVVLHHTGRIAMAVDSVLVALEIDPENPRALDALLDLSTSAPARSKNQDAPDFVAVFDQLESVYRRRDDSEALLARVLVGRGRLAVAAGDLAGAGDQLAAALALAPKERAVLEAHVAHRLELADHTGALAALDAVEPGDGERLYLWALLRRAEITADVALDDAAACALWQRALEIDGDCLDALYRLAQAEYAAGDVEAAGVAIERAIDVAAAPGRRAAISELARYYFLLGQIREAGGDDRAATAFRRAAEYDPGYPQPSIALARRAVAAGDRDGAQKLLVAAAHRAMAELGKAGAVPLQRELARILAAAGDRAAASEAYRGILAVSPTPADRVALAEVHAADDLSRAAAELDRVFAEFPMFGPAYEVAASYYDRLGLPARACRALSALGAMGMADDGDEQALVARRRQLRHTSPQRPLTARERGALVAGSPDPVLDRIFRELSPMLSERFPISFAGLDLVHFEQVASPVARASRAQIDHALGAGFEILVGREVPGGVIAQSAPLARAVIDIEIANGPDAELRFALGWAHEVVFRRLGPLVCGPLARRRQVVEVIAELVAGDSASPAIRALRGHLPPAIESQLAGRPPDSSAAHTWADFIAEVPCRAGLLFADDLRAAAAILDRLAGHHVRTTPILPALDRRTAPLVAYYLGPAHHRLHAAVYGSGAT